MELADVNRRDTRANQPAATAVPIGTVYYVTDESALERSNGTTWDSIASAGAIANDAVTYAKIQNVSAISKLLGRGSAAGAGDVEELTLGTNLSMSGITLNASGGSGALVLIEARTVIASPENFINLSGYADLLVILYGVTVSSTGAIRRLVVSTDNGASYLTGATDYLSFVASGAKTDKPSLDFDNGNDATAHYASLLISGVNLAAPKLVTPGFSTTNLTQMCTTLSAITAVRVLPHQNALNGGTIYLFGRPA